MRFKDMTVVVTGGARGIGRGISLAFGKEGANVTINYNSSEEAAREVASEIEAAGGKALLFKGSVSDHDLMKEMMAKTKESFGSLDILINNAAIYEDSVVWKMEKDVWDRVIDIDLTGPFNCTKHALPYMRETGFGRIINISSVVGQIGTFGTSNYSAAKAGLFGLTKAVAKETARKDITANCMALGFIDVGMLKALPENIQDGVLKQIPMNRFGKVEEVAKTAQFLASSDAAYITGQVIHVNGGYYM